MFRVTYVKLTLKTATLMSPCQIPTLWTYCWVWFFWLLDLRLPLELVCFSGYWCNKRRPMSIILDQILLIVFVAGFSSSVAKLGGCTVCSVGERGYIILKFVQDSVETILFFQNIFGQTKILITKQYPTPHDFLTDSSKPTAQIHNSRLVFDKDLFLKFVIRPLKCLKNV